jgi:hypothetical protein
VATPSGGATVSATVTNPGTGTARFDMEILGPLAQWACFESSGSCTPTARRFLNSGGSVTIPVVLSGLPSLARQTAVLAVQATASDGSSNPVITGVGHALVEVAGERGIGLEVAPTTITDDTLAPLPFQLGITNTGNLCDERYTMTFTSEPAGVVVTPETTSFVVPGGRSALVGAHAAAPAFGTYTLRVRVETDAANPLCPSAPSQGAEAELTLILSGDETAPVADAGANQQASVGVAVGLDGTQSYDPDGGSLSYVWSFESKPAGSALTNADIVGASTAQPSFTPDVPGAFVLALDVSDGALNDRDTTTVTAVAGPVADAGPDQQVLTGDLVQLDGSGSFDPDAGPGALANQWTFRAVPAGSALNDSDITDPDRATASFTPDVTGRFVIGLAVSDGDRTSTAATEVRAGAQNVPPVADAGDDVTSTPGGATVLDGGRSEDADQAPAPLGFAWRLVALPAGSALASSDLRDADTAAPSFTPDVAGTFVLRVVVSDGLDTDADNVAVRVGRGTGLEPAGDVFVRRADNHTNEGASIHLVVRGNSSRVLIRFDQNEIAAELGGRELLSAHLELQIEGPRPSGWGGAGGSLRVHRMTEPWSEGDGFYYRARPARNRTRGSGPGATWWCATDVAIEDRLRDCGGSDWWMRSTPRSNPQGIENPWLATPTDEVTIENRQTGTVLLDVTADVGAFLAGAPNHGWVVLKGPLGGGNLWLSSKEGLVPPKLVITAR